MSSSDKILSLKDFIASNPNFVEFENKNGTTPDSILKAQLNRLDEIKRRDQKMRQLHGLKEGETLETDDFRDQYANLVTATADLTGTDLTTALPSQDTSSSFAIPSSDVPVLTDTTLSSTSSGSIHHSRSSDTSIMEQDKDLPSEVNHDWNSVEHQYILVNLGHRDQRPKCKVPAIRILQSFASQEECIKMGHEINQVIKNTSIWMFRLHEPIVICRKTESQQDAVYTKAQSDAVTGLYDMHMTKVQRDFETNVKEKKTGEQDLSIHRQLKKKQETAKNHPRVKLLDSKFNDERNKKHMPEAETKYPRALEDRYQGFAVIRVLQDIRSEVMKNNKEEEPLIIIDGFFETEVGARHWMRNVASNYVRNENMHVVNMYEWLFPTLVDESKIAEEYRNSEQNLIMNQKKKEKDRVLNFDLWTAQKEKLRKLQEDETTKATSTNVLVDSSTEIKGE